MLLLLKKTFIFAPLIYPALVRQLFNLKYL